MVTSLTYGVQGNAQGGLWKHESRFKNMSFQPDSVLEDIHELQENFWCYEIPERRILFSECQESLRNKIMSRKTKKKKTVWAFQNLTNMTGSPYCSLEQHYCRCQCYDVKRLKGKQTFHKSPGSFPFPPPVIGNNFCKTFFPKRKRF